MSKYFYAIAFISFFSIQNISANCPGCIIDIPGGLAADTLYLSPAPNGMASSYYDQDISFRMPMTTTPVSQNDPSVPSGLDISEISIISISNLPPGLSWETNAQSYDPQSETDGCMKFCGTPLVPGLYVMEVTVEATVIVFSQTVTFPIEILIEPSSSTNDGFSITNNSGCGELIVDFENNIPSNGESGYSYNWNFGNGSTSLDENPSSQIYSTPGVYIVNYQATIDTFGFVLTRVGVNSVSCFDIPTFPDFSNNPDLHLEIEDPNGNVIFESETIDNTNPPLEFFPNIELEIGQYRMRVIDSDSGINGGDDVCADITFNQLSNGIFSTDDFEVELDVLNPTETILASDTVTVYAIPDQPIIFNSGADEFCAGETVTLSSSYDENNQWYQDGELMTGEVGGELEVLESGAYQVVYTSDEGCSSASEELVIIINENPENPTYDNVNNLLSLIAGITYDPTLFGLQWSFNGVILAGETSPEYCALESGIYTLEVVNLNTGCIASFTEQIEFDENLNCFSSTASLAEEINLEIYPNPVFDQLNISLNLSEAATLEIRFYDILGTLHNMEVITRDINGFSLIEAISVDKLPSGMHFVELRFGEQSIIQKFIKN